MRENRFMKALRETFIFYRKQTRFWKTLDDLDDELKSLQVANKPLTRFLSSVQVALIRYFEKGVFITSWKFSEGKGFEKILTISFMSFSKKEIFEPRRKDERASTPKI